MKNERELLMLFYDSDNRREVLRQPFLQDGKVCATDGHVLIRIDSSLCDGSYDEKPGGLTPPRTASVVPAATTDIAVTRQQIERALELAPEEQNRQCPECKGSGDVTWEYHDRYYELYTMEAECPMCDGSGTVDDYTVIKYQFIFCGKAFSYHYVKTLLAAMSWLDIDTIRLVNADAQPMLFKPENMDVEILLMPQIRDDKLGSVTVIEKKEEA